MQQPSPAIPLPPPPPPSYIYNYTVKRTLKIGQLLYSRQIPCLQCPSYRNSIYTTSKQRSPLLRTMYSQRTAISEITAKSRNLKP